MQSGVQIHVCLSNSNNYCEGQPETVLDFSGVAPAVPMQRSATYTIPAA